MKTNKGQALIEFVLVLPIIIFIISCFIDLSKIIYNKYILQNELSVLIELYNNSRTDEYNNYEFTITSDDTYTTISVESNVNISTPIVNNIIGKDYPLMEKAVILNE